MSATATAVTSLTIVAATWIPVATRSVILAAVADGQWQSDQNQSDRYRRIIPCKICHHEISTVVVKVSVETVWPRAKKIARRTSIFPGWNTTRLPSERPLGQLPAMSRQAPWAAVFSRQGVERHRRAI